MNLQDNICKIIFTWSASISWALSINFVKPKKTWSLSGRCCICTSGRFFLWAPSPELPAVHGLVIFRDKDRRGCIWQNPCILKWRILSCNPSIGAEIAFAFFSASYSSARRLDYMKTKFVVSQQCYLL